MTKETVVTNTEKPLLTVNLGRDNGMKEFRSIEEIEQWLNTEREFWAWLQAAATEDGNANEASSWQHFREGEIRNYINEAKSRLEIREDRLRQIGAWMQERYVDRHAIPSLSPRAKFIASIVPIDKVAAAHALWHLMGNDPRAHTRRAVTGYVLGAIHQLGLSFAPESVEQTVRDVLERMAREHETLRKTAGKLQDDFQSHSKSIFELHEEQKKAYSEAHGRRDTEHAALVQKHQKQMSDIEEAFKTKMELRAAVQYLKDSARTRRWLALAFGIGAAAAGVGVVFLAFYIGTSVFADASKVSPLQIGIAVLSATLAFWLLRILVRVFLSNLHLATDLRTRATFVHTYLALIAEGGAIKDEDRKHIISLVFRPTTDGLVRDDAAPPSWFELFTRTR